MTESDVIISDIHIGDNSRTCWYQRSVHEPYLIALLDWIIENRNNPQSEFTRLVILGDLFDFWTYPPHQRPPSTQQILDANPNLFGPNGKFRQVMDALDGNIVYLRGNHDITLSQADLDLIPTGEHKIKLIDDVSTINPNMVYTHGHLYTMFNAPDPRFRGDVPVGYFVTRAIAHLVEKTLKPGQTAADLKDQGSPYGMDLPSLIPSFSKFLDNPSVSSLLLDYVAQRCGVSENTPIVMADGSSMTIGAARAKYDGLFTQWVKRFGGGEFGELTAIKAAWADYDGTYMGWWAQRSAFLHNKTGIVMGHTHAPKALFDPPTWTRYFNSGFECPSIPDMKPPARAEFSFMLADGDSKVSQWKITRKGEDFSFNRWQPPHDHIVFGPSQDFSSYVKITNNTEHTLYRQEHVASYGYWVAEPPPQIPAFTTAYVWIQDKALRFGAEGTVTYALSNGTSQMKFEFGCPYVTNNYANGGAYLVASTKSPPTAVTPRNKVPPRDHPLFVEFFVAK